MFVCLKEHVNEENLYLVKEAIMNKLYYSILPFHNLRLCKRPHYVTIMCRYCTKLYIKDKKISDHINKELYVQIDEFLVQVSQGVVAARWINLFAHTNIHARKNDPFGVNFGSLYYESINSPFILWKLYLDVLCRIVFNVSHRFVFPQLESGVNLDCRKHTICTSRNCWNLKICKVRAIFYRELVALCKYLCKATCSTFVPYFIIDVFKGYKG